MAAQCACVLTHHTQLRTPPPAATRHQGILDPALELAKLQKKAGEVGGRIEALTKKMALPSYAEKTPQAVRDEEADKLAKAQAELAAAQQHMEEMRRMVAEGQGQAAQ
jgi:valyl-tRNA synthetase